MSALFEPEFSKKRNVLFHMYATSLYWGFSEFRLHLLLNKAVISLLKM